jgi:NAD(P)-dependent dehydrogenase (short-subunit alcohol dehydrogenase family)
MTATGTRLLGQVAVITGAAGGLGEAIARRMADEGAAVVLGDIQDDAGAAVAAGIGDAAVYRRCDVRRESDVAALVDAAVATHGRLDCMVNNAGIIGAVGPIDELPLDEWDATMAVQLRSVFLGMKHASRVMKPRERGAIISMSSVGGLRGGIAPHCYAAAKSAIVGLTRNVAAELGPWSIRVNAIAPGGAATPGGASFYAGDPGAVAELADRNLATSPLRGRAGSPADVAHAAVWLASDEGGYVSGTTVVVDGGLIGGTPPAAQRGFGPFAEHRPLYREGGLRGLDRPDGGVANAD